MNKEEIDKLFRRIELDKSSDICGFEFADSFSCTFDNIATCYDDRLKLYYLVKYQQNNLNKLKRENKQLKSTLEEIREYINSNCDFNGTALYDKWVAGKKILQIIDKGVEI